MALAWVPINQIFDATGTLTYPQLCNYDLPQAEVLSLKSGYAELVDNDTPIRLYIGGLNGAAQLGVGFYTDTYPRYNIYIQDTTPIETSFNIIYEGYGYPEINSMPNGFPYNSPSSPVELYVDFYIETGTPAVWTSFRGSIETTTE